MRLAFFSSSIYVKPLRLLGSLEYMRFGHGGAWWWLVRAMKVSKLRQVYAHHSKSIKYSYQKKVSIFLCLMNNSWKIKKKMKHPLLKSNMIYHKKVCLSMGLSVMSVLYPKKVAELGNVAKQSYRYASQVTKMQSESLKIKTVFTAKLFKNE